MIEGLTLSRFSPAVERAVSTAIKSSLGRMPHIRARLEGRLWRQAVANVCTELSAHSECLLAQIDDGVLRSTYMVRSETVIDVMSHAEACLEVVSFITNLGAITLSFDRNEDDDENMYVHIVSWGHLNAYVRESAMSVGGELY